jgi:hypothetical protein
MLNTCFRCGIYRVDKIIDPDGPVAICPECGHRHRFAQLPSLIVSGASGAGKSTACQKLIGRLTQVVLLDSDILWRSEFNTPEDNYAGIFETWLRMCKNISQSGRPVVLFGAGIGVPGNLDSTGGLNPTVARSRPSGCWIQLILMNKLPLTGSNCGSMKSSGTLSIIMQVKVEYDYLFETATAFGVR